MAEFNGKFYRRYATGVWPEFVAQMRKKLKAEGYLVRVRTSWKVGRKDIYVRKANPDPVGE